MTVETLITAEECIEQMNYKGTVFRYKHTENKKILYAVFPFVQHIDIFDSPYCEDIKLIYDGTKWLL